MNPAVKRLLLKSRLRPFAGVAYRTIINLELAALRMLDSLSNPERLPECGGLEQLTALIKAFERPRTLARLVASIQQHYPGMNILVVDDSRQPKPIPGIEWLTLPFDSGVSAGRSAGLGHVRTPFTLLLDDDFVFYFGTGLRAALASMVKYPEIDIMGGTVLKLPLFHKADYSTIKLYPTTAKPVRPLGGHIGPLPVFDKVANFYIAHTER
ncbi:MAG: glycosyltransferase family 2 protein [Clostridia bacterium]|nr:glycosyltransferase family 2 protein [Clostridia bacterium]